MKKIAGYEDRYFADEQGNIYQKERRWVSGNGSQRYLPQRQMLVYTNRGGYRIVHIITEGRLKTRSVHRLIALTFIPNPKNKPQVNHKNGNKSDNSVSNLEWATSSENMEHARQNGLIVPAMGERVGGSKLKTEQVVEIFHSGASLGELASRFNVSKATVCYIKKGVKWRHVTSLYANGVCQ